MITIPLLDEQFVIKQASELKHEPASVMRSRLEKIERRLVELEGKAEASGEAAAGREVTAYRVSGVLEDIDKRIGSWEVDDHVAAGQARNLLVDAAKMVKELASKVEWPARVTTASSGAKPSTCSASFLRKLSGMRRGKYAFWWPVALNMSSRARCIFSQMA